MTIKQISVNWWQLKAPGLVFHGLSREEVLGRYLSHIRREHYKALEKIGMEVI
jgi:hypothetical protein